MDKERKRILDIIYKRKTLWLSHGCDGQLASPYSQLSIVGELDVIIEKIENLKK